jgi:hypothetical protein
VINTHIVTILDTPAKWSALIYHHPLPAHEISLSRSFSLQYRGSYVRWRPSKGSLIALIKPIIIGWLSFNDGSSERWFRESISIKALGDCVSRAIRWRSVSKFVGVVSGQRQAGNCALGYPPLLKQSCLITTESQILREGLNDYLFPPLPLCCFSRTTF